MFSCKCKAFQQQVENNDLMKWYITIKEKTCQIKITKCVQYYYNTKYFVHKTSVADPVHFFGSGSMDPVIKIRIPTR